MASRVRLPLTVALLVAVVAAGLFLLARSWEDEATRRELPSAGVPSEARRGENDRGAETRTTSPPPRLPAATKLDPRLALTRVAARPASLEARSYREELARYGYASVPAPRSPERAQIDFGVPRSVGPSGELIATQNRAFLANEEVAILRLQAATPGETIAVGEASLERLRGESDAEVIGVVRIEEDAALSRSSPSPIYAGTFSAEALGGLPGTVRVRVPVVLRGLSFEVRYQFELTGSTTAALISVEGHAIVEGDLSFTLRLDVGRPGTYAFEARVLNARDEVVALVKAERALGMGTGTASLVLDGLFIRDWMPPGPYRITDIEAWRLNPGSAIPKQTVPPWRDSYPFAIDEHAPLRATPRAPAPSAARPALPTVAIP